jgi:catechol 2,3-dioxygenase-like lactoylglutathione lyase family enzyme
MLSQRTPIATLPTADMSKAQTFYEGTLGLRPERHDVAGTFYNCGDGSIFVYASAYAGTNKATAMTFAVPLEDFDAEIEVLRGKGVALLTFDLEGVVWKDGVASIGDGARAVWFADPDGNIINVTGGTM